MNVNSDRTAGSFVAPFPYFRRLTCGKILIYGTATLYVVSVFAASVIEPFVELSCTLDQTELDFENPAYDANPCRQVRYLILLGLTPEECCFARRLVASIILGGIIGWERRQADRPAGIRTMAVVSLGACLFTINSTFAFLQGPMSWDASRVSAAIPSGVGFLGAGLIFKKEEKHDDGSSNQIVHGLTTAASLWLSAAVGIACGGELYFAASFGAALMMALLRFGPRSTETEDEEDDDSASLDAVRKQGYSAVDTETTGLTNRGQKSFRKKKRSSASLDAAV